MIFGKRPPLFAALLAVAGCNTPTLLDCDNPNHVNESPEQLERCLTGAGARVHLDALQGIADRNNNNRAAGTNGHEESVTYIADLLREAGYQISFHEFTFDDFVRLGPSLVEDQSGNDLNENTDYLVAEFSGTETATAPVTAVDLQLGLGNTTTSACEASDFANFPAGHIALVQRGTCTFDTKVQNAVDAGAVGVVMMNQGNTQQRRGVFAPFLSPGFDIPVIGTSSEVGEEFSRRELSLTLVINAEQKQVPTRNLIAETPKGRTDQVIALGAHLDSVPAGPGINDDGSGTAALVELALQLKNTEPVNKLRFIWWSAEELGLLGSFDYTATLPQEELEKIALYLNFDMVASPNFVREIYDGDGSAFGEPGPAGSDEIEARLRNFFTQRDLKTSSTELLIPSDSTPFALVGIPVGGIFTGANEPKTAFDGELYGGEVGAPRDPCYHGACDTTENISAEVLEEMVDAIGLVTFSYAQDTRTFPPREVTRTRARRAAASLDGCHSDERPNR